jgi:NAD+--asparagine ADP-ribosyltransferase
MNKLELEQNKYINTLYSIVDKLEQRIKTLEKVLESHAKCIGEMRGEENELERSNN